MPFLRALITGGAGFLGSHLCEQLVDTGTEVVCLDNLSTAAPTTSHTCDDGRMIPTFVQQALAGRDITVSGRGARPARSATSTTQCAG
jgi:nucleoside-diphosphate-sugar epimerase